MHWVTMWGNAQSTVVPSPAVYAKDITLRYPIFIPFSGKRIRITFDNFCCDEDVRIEGAYLSLGRDLTDETIGEPILLTKNGSSSFIIPKGESFTSDPIDIDLKEGTYLIISFYLKEFTKLTSGVDIVGPLSKGYYAYGNQVLKRRLDINTSKSTSWVYFLANIDLYTEDTNEAIICYGDSITSQDWPDYLLLALRKAGIRNRSVVRKAISGTRILREYTCITYQSYGYSGYHRFEHEISSVAGAKTILIQHGINDIIHPVGVEVNPFRPMTDLPTSEELIEGLKFYNRLCKKYHLKVFYGTLLPIYGWRTYQEFREGLKNEVNEWIRKQACIDFEKEIGIARNGYIQFLEDCDSGDHLHPSKEGYKRMGSLAARTLVDGL